MQPHSRVRGFTLLELMVSLTLGLVLFCGVMAFYLAAMKNFTQAANARQNGTEAQAMLHLLKNEVSRAGQVCGPRFLFANQAILTVYPHSLHVAYQAEPQVNLLGLSSDKQTLLLEAAYRHEPRQRLIIADKDHAEVAVVQRAYDTSRGEVVALMAPLHTVFTTTACIGRFVDNTYYLDESTHQLVVENGDHRHQHLFDDVLALHFTPDQQDSRVVGVFIDLAVGAAPHLQHLAGYAPVWSQVE